MSENARLFFALWPSPETARAIWRASADWLPKGAGRRLPPEHLHITLAFLGRIDPAVRACMEQAATLIHAQAFDLTLDEPGHFARAQVVWLGTRSMPEALLNFQQLLVEQLTNNCDFQPETRAFVPHLTLWRKIKRFQIPANLSSISWNVQRFVLAASQTLPTGAHYTILREWSLE